MGTQRKRNWFAKRSVKQVPRLRKLWTDWTQRKLAERETRSFWRILTRFHAKNMPYWDDIKGNRRPDKVQIRTWSRKSKENERIWES
jgi:hypothetical protein